MQFYNKLNYIFCGCKKCNCLLKVLFSEVLSFIQELLNVLCSDLIDGRIAPLLVEPTQYQLAVVSGCGFDALRLVGRI
ncbi:MAG: hypothetical protein J6C40_04875, partial [Lentisphaeria bacterium]|nr:hypothetical protein [Lentisphaeria bacterium]